MLRYLLAVLLLVAGAASARADAVASCNGFSGSDGVTTASSTTFTSATGSFNTKASAGMTISISGAGANQSAKTAVVTAGGSGYVPLEVITVTGGTKLEIMSVSSGAVTAARVYTRVSQASPSASVSQTATTGSGTGATFTITYTRDNHVTTIASITNSTTIVLTAAASVSNTAARWGAGTPKDSAVATAIAVDGEAILPRGECLFTSTINLAAGQSLTGKGAGVNKAGTALLWGGSPNGTQFTAYTATFASSGITAGNFDLDGLGSASLGAVFTSLQDSYIYPLTAEGQTVASFVIDGQTSYPSQAVTFEGLGAFLNYPTVSSETQGIILGLSSNINHLLFNRIAVQHINGHGIVCHASDSNVIMMDTEQVVASGTGLGIVMYGGNGLTGKCQANRWVYSDAVAGTYVYGTESGFVDFANRNYQYVNTTNGATLPNLDASANILCGSSYGGNCATTGIAGSMTYKSETKNKIANYTLRDEDSGTFFSNKGAAAQVNFTLPGATGTGYRACFSRASAFKVLVDVSGSDVIKAPGLVSSAGGDFYTTTADSVMCLVDIDTNRWQAESLDGTWVAE